MINISKQEKEKLNLIEMRERTEKVEQLREEQFLKRSSAEREELSSLKVLKATKEGFELKSINIQIDEL